MFPGVNSVGNDAYAWFEALSGAVSIAKIETKDFIRNKMVVPVEIEELVGAVNEGARPEAFAFSEVVHIRQLY